MGEAKRRREWDARRRRGDPDAAAPDRATVLRLAAGMIEGDASISGVTIFLPDGTTRYVDAATVRRGGNA